jgi:hypothetical protein
MDVSLAEKTDIFEAKISSMALCSTQIPHVGKGSSGAGFLRI